MNTPIHDFVSAYAKEHPIRLHMPGHKGEGALGVEALDITEIGGADSLYEASGIIAESEGNATSLFGTKATFYSTEGSSHCIRSMLWLLKCYAAHACRQASVLAFRNAHKSFVTASALLGIHVRYLHPASSASYLACPISAEQLAAALDDCVQLPTAVYVTTPDYLGNLADVASLSEVCHARGVLLFCDNAHGAYLKFLCPSLHPADLGADLCCDSAHKTLPVLTGGAYLQIAQNAPDFFVENAKNALSLFGSTSPSYLILQSLDLANAHLADGYRERLAAFLCRLNALKAALTAHGYCLWGNEPLKLTVHARAYGYRGDEMAQYLRTLGIEVEFADPDVLVMMFTPAITNEALFLVKDALLRLPQRGAALQSPPAYRPKEQAMSAKDAIAAPCETVQVKDALGRILACPTVGCPPAVPILTCGERIDAHAIEVFAYYGITTCSVVKE